MQSFPLDGFTGQDLKLALFKNVSNGQDLKQKYSNRVALIDAGEFSAFSDGTVCHFCSLFHNSGGGECTAILKSVLETNYLP